MNVSIHKITGGFAGTTNYQLRLYIDLGWSISDNEDLLKDAQSAAQKIIDEKFPEARIKIEEKFVITEHSL